MIRNINKGIVEASIQGSTIPGDVAYDENGQLTTDANAALKGAIRAFDRSYKGFGLGLMVELLAGALGGATMVDKKNANNWGNMIIAMDPEIVEDKEVFVNRVEQVIELYDFYEIITAIFSLFPYVFKFLLYLYYNFLLFLF